MSMNTNPKDSNQSSIFSNMTSLLNPSEGLWPTNIFLPYPTIQTDSYNTSQGSESVVDKRKRSKEITACPHKLRKHYAKNMCNNCYHKNGRDRNAWKCQHSERKHYAKGFCQNCYLKNYNSKKAEVSKKVVI